MNKIDISPAFAAVRILLYVFLSVCLFLSSGYAVQLEDDSGALELKVSENLYENDLKEIDKTSKPDFTRNNIIGEGGAPLYPDPLLQEKPITVLDAGTRVVMLDRSPRAVRFGHCEYNYDFALVFKVKADGQYGYVRADHVVRLAPSLLDRNIVRNTVGCRRLGMWSGGYCPLETFWLRTGPESFKYLGICWPYCGMNKISWSPSGKYFFLKLAGGKDCNTPYLSRIISSTGEVVFEQTYKYDSPTWVDDERLFLRGTQGMDDVFIYDFNIRELKNLLKYKGEPYSHPEDDCGSPPDPVKFDPGKQEVEAVFRRVSKTGNNPGCNVIIIKCGLDGSVVSKETTFEAE